MALFLVSTPIGNPKDISLRALETLRSSDIVIGEERREVSKLLKSLEIEGKAIELLNEHTKDSELLDLASLCKENKIALVTDCGTPGFCDPGSRLVEQCRKMKIPVSPVPGASSLMCLLAVSGQAMTEFLFRGFLPAEKNAREAALKEIGRSPRPIIIMDTPYRFTKLLKELAQLYPDRRALVGSQLTLENENIVEGSLKDLPEVFGDIKAEFILAIWPSATRAANEITTSNAVKPTAKKNKRQHPFFSRDKKNASAKHRQNSHRQPGKKAKSRHD